MFLAFLLTTCIVTAVNTVLINFNLLYSFATALLYIRGLKLAVRIHISLGLGNIN